MSRCPSCGYTAEDAELHGDHHLCKSYPFFDWEVAGEGIKAAGHQNSTPALALVGMFETMQRALKEIADAVDERMAVLEQRVAALEADELGSLAKETAHDETLKKIDDAFMRVWERLGALEVRK